MNPKVYTIEYSLKNDNGEVVDTSVGGEPLVVMEGTKQVVLGLEKALSGREPGEKLEVTVPPELAYGPRREDLVQQVHISQFDGVSDLQAGMIFQTQSGDQRHVVKVVEIRGDQVTIDANHPLAGFSLNFEVEIKAVREATDEELKQGYALS
ncbi:peptidylprolyl isomerase [Hahella sp. CCB-MM4]|uniref:FKBP-type peptidyl-prolyl cis-trans isomerase n=1 Tax=Hahella sp. (strain CCB-MM4) TaxID=1926491 RepID=UPI000B9BDEC7|nr:peptidylprolyl isomerase [Hahella sp. CCB-MM4]OZG70660.1 peptidylprolyl isomerase [Hahella sp. CCB-MM4]